MMYVKGQIISNLPIFIKERFGDRGFYRWDSNLSWQAIDIYHSTIIDGEWYPLKIALSEPMDTACKMFYTDSLHGAIEFGRYLGDREKNKKNKFFPFPIKMDYESPLKKACDTLRSYYRPANVILANMNGNSATIQIKDFPESDITEVIIAGWFQRMLGRDNSKNAFIEMKRKTKNGISIEYLVKWNAS